MYAASLTFATLAGFEIYNTFKSDVRRQPEEGGGGLRESPSVEVNLLHRNASCASGSSENLCDI